MIVVGIDIGLDGALSFVGRDESAVVDMPVILNAEGKRRIHGRGLLDALRQYCPVGSPILVGFEDVQPRPFGNANAHGNSIQSQGSLMRSRGAVEAVLDVMGVRSEDCKIVQPQAWKSFYGLIGQKKGESSHRARVLFPEVADSLTRVKDHNRAEALLIANFVRRKYA